MSNWHFVSIKVGSEIKMTTRRDGSRYEDWSEDLERNDTFHAAKHFGDGEWDSATIVTLEPAEMSQSRILNMIHAAIKWHEDHGYKFGGPVEDVKF